MASVVSSPDSGVDHQASLQSRLQSVANRMRAIGICDSVCWLLAALGIALLTFAWLDIIWQLPIGVRQVIVPLTVLVGLGLFGWLIYRRFSDTNKVSVAKRLDQVGGTGGQILSGLDMINERDLANDSRSELSPLARGIASVAVSQASQRAANVDSSDAAPWSIAKRSATIAAAVAVVLMMFGFFAPNAFSTSTKRLFSPTVDTPPYTPLQFSVSPGDVTLTSVSYTHLTLPTIYSV